MDDPHSGRPNGASVNMKKYFTRWIEELDRRYTAQFDAQQTAVASAFQAQKELNRIVSEASDKAIRKAEDAQTKYNERSNEFRGALDDQAKLMSTTMMLRSEALGMFKNQSEKLDDLKKELITLRENTVVHGGEAQGAQHFKNESRANVALIISAVSVIIAIVVSFILRK